MASSRKPHKLYNLILPLSIERCQVLLGFKKRGFGVGKYNGFGGKVEPGESLVASASRELYEEANILCSENQLQHVGILLLETLAHGTEKDAILEIHVYICTNWEGEITE